MLANLPAALNRSNERWTAGACPLAGNGAGGSMRPVPPETHHNLSLYWRAQGKFARPTAHNLSPRPTSALLSGTHSLSPAPPAPNLTPVPAPAPALPVPALPPP